MNGLLNLAFPPLFALDGALATFLPALVRVILYGAIAGAIAMGVYRLVSNQADIKERQARLKAIRAEIQANQDDFQKVMALSKRNLGESMGLLGRSIGPAVISGLPVLFVIAWVSAAYGFERPAPGVPVAFAGSPAGANLRVEPEPLDAAQGVLLWPGALGEARLVDDSGPVFDALPLDPPVSAVHERAWWNWLWGNPAGYTEPGAATERVEFALERLRLVNGPWWASTWELPFFVATLIASLAIKIGFKIG